jgi:hypothetical protein
MTIRPNIDVRAVLYDSVGEAIGGSNPIAVDAQFTGSATPRITANFDKPADATQYTIGDIIGNSLTANLVVPITFDLDGIESGRITGARCTITPASGNSVLTALDFDLLLFRPEANIPFAAAGYPADNGVLTVSPTAMRELVGVLRFSNGQWRGPLGTVAVGASNYQSAAPSSRPFFPFNVEDLTDSLLGIVQVAAAWNPGNVANNFHFALDVDPD